MNDTGVANRLARLRDQLGKYVVESMYEMTVGSETAKKDMALMKGIWYPQDYIDAFETTQTKWINFLRENGSLVNGWMPKGYWEPVYDSIDSNTIKRRAWTFLAKEKVLPSAAIKAAKVGLCILDCGAVCQIARYDALLKVLGEDKFNRLFSGEKGQRINIGYAIDDDLQPMRYFVDFTEAAKKGASGSLGKRMVKIGQLVLFNGVSDYQKKHPNGMGANFNVICMYETEGVQKYLGHGLSSNGETEKQIAVRMVKEFNQHPNYFSRIPEAVKNEMNNIIEENKSEALKERSIKLEHALKNVSGFDRGSPQDFCLPLIADLMNTPVDQVSMDFVKQHPKANREIMQTNELTELLIYKNLKMQSDMKQDK